MVEKPVISFITDTLYRKPNILVPPGWSYVFNKTRDTDDPYPLDIAIVMAQKPRTHIKNFYAKGHSPIIGENILYLKTNESGYPTSGARARFIREYLRLLIKLKTSEYDNNKKVIRIRETLSVKKHTIKEAVDDLIWWSGKERQYFIGTNVNDDVALNTVIDSKCRDLYYIMTEYQDIHYLCGVIFRYPNSNNYDLLMMEPRICYNAIRKKYNHWTFLGDHHTSLDTLFKTEKE